MTSVMSYQYSIPSDVASNLINDYHLPALASTEHLQNLHKSAVTPTRGDSLEGSKLVKMKRSSAPSVPGQARPDAKDAALSAEKRRNKLGYHRTSVACGHCRRRKIRCIPAQGDPQSRCSNCIRLKKPCNFFPVDQQPQAVDAGNPGDSQAQGGVGTASPSSSPTESTDPAEVQNSLSFSHLNLPPTQDIGSAQIKGTESFPSDKKEPPPFTQSHDLGSSAAWMSTEQINMSKDSPDMSSSYWRMGSNESPGAAAFSPFPQSLHLSHHPTWSPAATEPSPREEYGWTVPQRSMSYGSQEALLHQQGYSFHSPTNGRDDFSSRPSPNPLDIYSSLPPTTGSLSTADVTVMTPTTTTPQSSGSAPPFPQVWQQQFPYKVPAVPSNDGYPVWFGSSSTLSSAQGTEGDGTQHVPTYGHPEPYNGMYYQNTNSGR